MTMNKRKNYEISHIISEVDMYIGPSYTIFHCITKAWWGKTSIQRTAFAHNKFPMHDLCNIIKAG